MSVTYRAGHGGMVDTSLDRVAAGDVLAGLPAREFRWYKGRRHYSGWYWSATTGRLVAYESRLELARIMLADFDPGVTAIAAQPFRLAGPDGAGTRRHVPDVLLADAAGVTVVDVKAPGKRDDPAVRAVMDWARAVAGLRGWGFEDWYGADPGLLANVSFLAGYRRSSVIDGRLVPTVPAAAGGGTPVAAIERQAGAPAVLVRPWLSLDGGAVEVVSLDGATVTVRNAAGGWQAIGTAALLARAFPLDVPETAPPPAGLLLAGLDASRREAVSERAGHVREMLTGYRSGSAQAARPGEPRPEFAPPVSVAGREQAKAAELGVTTRTVRRWARAYREGGEAALVDERKTAGRGKAVDERWEDACRSVLAERAGESTPAAGAVLRQAAARLEEEHGPGTVPLPSPASAYRHPGAHRQGHPTR